MKDAYATIDDGEVWLRNLHIPPYQPAARDNHPPERERKLLLHKREIDKVVGRIAEKGWTLVPTRIYFSNGRAKVELALARGKDRFDKRQSIKAREMTRDMDRQLRDVGR
jgi:SsrA-binding protein